MIFMFEVNKEGAFYLIHITIQSQKDLEIGQLIPTQILFEWPLNT